MKKMIAYCGLTCTDCEAFIATKNNDDKLRSKVATEWSKKYHHDFKPEDINCVGCIPVAGKHVGQCSVCEVRLCGQQKGVANCAYCPDYGCAKLEGYFQMALVMKTNLEGIRKGLKKA
jgi:hypothetical protein